MTERILGGTFVPVFDSSKNVASAPSSMLERTSFFFEHSSLLILFFTLRKKSQLLKVFIYLFRFYFVTLRYEKPFSPFLLVSREPMRESSSLEYDIKTNYENEKI